MSPAQSVFFHVNEKNKYHPVELEMMTLDIICDQPIYLKNESQYVLYRSARLPFTQKDKDRLTAAKNNTVYIHCETDQELRRFFEANLPNIIDNPKIPTKQKADVLYKCATGITHDIFQNPNNQESIGKTKDVVNNTVRLLAQGSDAFIQMISLSSHDYYTYTHCVNVMTFSVGLLSLMGVKDSNVLKEAGMGALLHDVGKAKVPLQVLNKPGPLTEDEWSVMKKHPGWGFEMLEKSVMPSRGKQIIVQHHEKISGAGYPFGLRGEAIDLTSQVVSLCDAYDAMTTNRCYQKALKPLQAFQIITQKMNGHFDFTIVEKFIHLLNLKKSA